MSKCFDLCKFKNSKDSTTPIEKFEEANASRIGSNAPSNLTCFGGDSSGFNLWDSSPHLEDHLTAISSN
ncbi:hypothetical protein H5410_061766 [Solanum commersonii]|uniref:Uncharacterized protein n=1 Tax=Solanum commersonii TaxID=4109 RepID=A0A9J5WA67_SOLCO|nr:hypothetical protein H5410_061766 [Solanum commersonii]